MDSLEVMGAHRRLTTSDVVYVRLHVREWEMPIVEAYLVYQEEALRLPRSPGGVCCWEEVVERTGARFFTKVSRGRGLSRDI
jgi:hypothetical protein